MGNAADDRLNEGRHYTSIEPEGAKKAGRVMILPSHRGPEDRRRGLIVDEQNARDIEEAIRLGAPIDQLARHRNLELVEVRVVDSLAARRPIC